MMNRLQMLCLTLLMAQTAIAQTTAPADRRPLTTGPAASQPAADLPVPPPRQLMSPEQKREAARQVVERFVAHVQQSDAFDAGAKSAVAEAWKSFKADEDPEGFLMAGVAMLSEPFREGMEAAESGEEGWFPKAEASLRPLLDAKDFYIATHARVMLARAMVERERLDDAEELLTPLTSLWADLREKTFLEAEVAFLLGYSQLSNLHYDRSLVTLEQFQRDFPDAPDSLRLPATQMLQELKIRQPESLGEISDLMVYAGRRLSNGQADTPVHITQDRAVELLNKLIEQAEQREQQANSGGQSESQGQQSNRGNSQGNPQGNQPPGSPANQSVLPGGEGRMGDLRRSSAARPGEAWGMMRPEERERVLQSLRQNFPGRYRQLVEQYYKQLGKEK